MSAEKLKMAGFGEAMSELITLSSAPPETLGEWKSYLGRMRIIVPRLKEGIHELEGIMGNAERILLDLSWNQCVKGGRP